MLKGIKTAVQLGILVRFLYDSNTNYNKRGASVAEWWPRRLHVVDAVILLSELQSQLKNIELSIFCLGSSNQFGRVGHRLGSDYYWILAASVNWWLYSVTGGAIYAFDIWRQYTSKLETWLSVFLIILMATFAPHPLPLG